MLALRIIVFVMFCVESFRCQQQQQSRKTTHLRTRPLVDGGRQNDHDQTVSDVDLDKSLELNRTSIAATRALPGQQDRSDAEADSDNEESSQDQVFLEQHQTHLKQLEDMFEKRQSSDRRRLVRPLQQSGQMLNPTLLGMNPPPVVGHFGQHPKMVNNPAAGLGTPNLPFAFGQLPHLLGLQGPSPGLGPVGPVGAVEGEEGVSEDENGTPPEIEPRIGPGGQKIWPKIFRFTDGRANLAEFERQKKVRLSQMSNNGENQIDAAPIIFDGRPLKRRSFLILHGGIFAR